MYDALNEYRAAHVEVTDQLMLEAQKEMDGEDEAVVEQVLAEGIRYNVRPFIGEVMATFGKLIVLLRIQLRKKEAD
ncbi:MAG: hypothetical protein GY696_26280 [Gammaproteobacteria bacterium]|nr:hypothetical protein [Gammaproteobacteria bacterium]